MSRSGNCHTLWRIFCGRLGPPNSRTFKLLIVFPLGVELTIDHTSSRQRSSAYLLRISPEPEYWA
jgi:hypothetical protein